jgi:rhamnose utilization protein RhaD (predicted bifunctional aldolase and dehydrogenase)
MLESRDICDYVKLSRMIGGYSELVQGSGGNISVKNASYICIKSSGRLLSETELDFGYSICSIDKLKELLDNNDENTKNTVVGGETNSLPSMEVFFHLLPYKWIVHIHPTFLLTYLCSDKWKSISTSLKSAYIPYKTPGLELSKYIHSVYDEERLIFLQNHGIIVCGETPLEICNIIDKLYTDNASIINSRFNHICLSDIFLLLEEIKNKTGIEPVIKNTYKDIFLHDRLFFSLTPDIVLFLKKYPLVKEDSSENVIHLFDKYYNLHNYIPAVIKIKDRIFVLGKSFKHCLAIEELLYSYLDILSSIRINDIHTLYDDNVFALQNSGKEIHRMNIL